MILFRLQYYKSGNGMAIIAEIDISLQLPLKTSRHLSVNLREPLHNHSCVSLSERNCDKK